MLWLGLFANVLFAFQEELAGIRVLDAACGSANFLYVALAEQLTLEKEVSTYAARNGLPAAAAHPTGAQRDAIAAAACELDRLRQNWLNPAGASEAELKQRTLTNLYNARPAWLGNAHDRLDRAVWAAYGWPEAPAATDDETILARLLALNLERSSP
jgi:hypothetical protein